MNSFIIKSLILVCILLVAGGNSFSMEKIRYIIDKNKEVQKFLLGRIVSKQQGTVLPESPSMIVDGTVEIKDVIDPLHGEKFGSLRIENIIGHVFGIVKVNELYLFAISNEHCVGLVRVENGSVVKSVGELEGIHKFIMKRLGKPFPDYFRTELEVPSLAPGESHKIVPIDKIADE